MEVVLNKSYGEKIIFKDNKFYIKENAINLIKGPSGLGKTTFLRLISSLEEGSSNIDLKFSFLFQEDRLLEHLSAFDNISLVNDNKEKIITSLSSLALDNTDQKVKEFSGGMKRRVAIIRALLASYDILLLDEPFKGLDTNNIKKTADFIKSENNDRTMIIVSHDDYIYDLFNIENEITI